MDAAEWLKHETVESWPWLLPDELIDALIREGSELGHLVPDGPIPPFDLHLHALREKIREVNLEVMAARTRDAVAAAEARLQVLRTDEATILNGFRRIAMEGLRLTRFIGYGFKDSSGRRSIVPPGAWPRATVDWKAGSVTVDGVTYADVRFIRYEGLYPTVRYAINRDLRSTGMFIPYGPEEEPPAPESTATMGAAEAAPDTAAPDTETTAPIYASGAPGRPTSMHLAEAELRRRAESAELAPSMTAEAELLETWLRLAHPEAPPLTAKTIRNTLGSLYRALLQKSSRAT